MANKLQEADVPDETIVQTSAPTSPPPGGGRWKWDAVAVQWVPNEPQDAIN